MSKVITFSTNFPSYHPKAGLPTYFVEKIWAGVNVDFDYKAILMALGLADPMRVCFAKHHTIRAGNRWKVGDKFSPRVWSGRPYNSKQVVIGPDIEVKKTWDIEINYRGGVAFFEVVIEREIYGQTHNGYDRDRNRRGLELLAESDGLSLDDLKAWFNKSVFKGQIICWNDSIEY